MDFKEIIEESGFFDELFYLEHYRDVRVSDELPLEHFVNHGLKEDRKPNEWFDPVWYREYYEDIENTKEIPFIHYVLYGEKENRLSNEKEIKHKKLLLIVSIPRSGLTLFTGILKSCEDISTFSLPFQIGKIENAPLTFRELQHTLETSKSNIALTSSTSDDGAFNKLIDTSLNFKKISNISVDYTWLVRNFNSVYLSLQEATYKYWDADSIDITEKSYKVFFDFFFKGYRKIVEECFVSEHQLISYKNLLKTSSINLMKNFDCELNTITYEKIKGNKIYGDPGFQNFTSIDEQREKERTKEWEQYLYLFESLNENQQNFIEFFNRLVEWVEKLENNFLQDFLIQEAKAYFDEAFYLNRYEDIKQVKIDPWEHFLKFGWKEGRQPNSEFSTLWYRDNVLKSLKINPLLHYVAIGRFSGLKLGVSSIRKMKNLIIIDPENYKISDDLILEAPKFKKVKVSILIPAYNQENYTLACIESIIKNTEGVSYEIIIMDDKSSNPEAQAIKANLKNIKFIVNEVNYGFLRNCNKGATFAIGEYILFLNNDTNVQSGWLSSLVELIESSDDIGMVGSRLVYPTGEQQEAGGIIWNDASGWNFGRLDDPSKPEFNYVKEADYLTGAAMMIRTSLWKKIGGFDERFVPAYYEDSDLAFEVRKHGYRVMYQPKSIVIHFEGISNGTDLGSGIKQYQVINKQNFFEKWKDVLNQEHFPNGQDVFLARDRSKNKKHILIIDHYVPHFDQDAGSRTMWQYLLLFKNLGYHVTFVGDNFYNHEPYTSMLENYGIEILYGEYYANHFDNWLELNGKYINSVYLLRPHIAIKYIDRIKKYTKATIFYNGTDFHFLRMQREYNITKDSQLLIDITNTKKIEIDLFEKSDCVLTISEYERDYFKKEFSPWNVELIPTYIYNEELPLSKNSYIVREGILFVGGFVHKPNLEGVKWFLKDIWPLIIKKNPHMKFYIVGSHMPDEIKNLESENIIPKGFVSDEELALLYDNTKIVVAPLTFGAGVKGKIIEAICNGVPTVTTSVGAEGIIDANSVLSIADKPDKFATNIIQLYNDSKQWENMREKQSLYAQKHFNLKNVKTYIDDVFSKDYK